jgi:PQQ enzyme-like repeat protein
MPDPAGILDLDVAPAPHRPTSGPGRRSPWVTALLVVAGVATVLTGPTGPPALPLVWQAATTNPYLWLAGGSVYTVDAADAAVRLTARDLRTGRVVWSIELTGPLAQAYASQSSVMLTRFPPRLNDIARTEAVSTVGDREPLAFPAVAMPLVHLADDVAVLIDRDTTVGPAPGVPPVDQLAGLQWTYRVTALDLATGAVRWTRALPAGVRWSLPGVRPGSVGLVGLPPQAASANTGRLGHPWLVTSSADGQVAVWDLATGRDLVRRDLGPLEPEAYVLALADAVLIRHRGPSGPTVQLLDLVTLTPYAHFVPDLPEAEPLSCAPAVCLTANGGVALVDAATGATRLQLTGTQVRPGPAGRLLVSGLGRPVSIVDTQAGTVTTLHDWQLVDTSTYGPRAVLAGRVDANGGALVGLLDVTSAAFAASGRVAHWATGSRCQSDATYLACGDGTTLTVWRWRS